jgi:hypothetical protein
MPEQVTKVEQEDNIYQNNFQKNLPEFWKVFYF